MLASFTAREDITLKQFTSYTSPDSLRPMRQKIDQGRTGADMVMHFLYNGYLPAAYAERGAGW